jgi:predicted ribosomally synthesized peptide with nif11-like leader
MDVVDKIKQLTDIASEDAEFKSRLDEAADARDSKAIVALAQEKGIDLTLADITPADPAPSGQELDADELEAVAGGTKTGDAILANCEKLSAFFCGFYALSSLWAGAGNE